MQGFASHLVPILLIVLSMWPILPRRSWIPFYNAMMQNWYLVLYICFVLFFIGIVHYSENIGRFSISIGGTKTVAAYLFILLFSYLLLSYNYTMGVNDYAISRYGDTVSFFTQAKMFAGGFLKVPSPANKEFYNTISCVNNGDYYGKYPPGWAGLLALGILLHLPWVLNPILTVLTVLIIFLLGVRFYDRNTAWIASILAGTSGIVMWGAMGYFSDTFAMFASTLFIYCIVRVLESSSRLFSVIAGISLGVLFLTKPYPAVAIAIPAFLYSISYLRTNRKLLACGVIVVAVFLPFIALLLLYNQMVTGMALLFPHTLYHPGGRLGFGLRSDDVFFPLKYFGPLDLPRNFLQTCYELNCYGIPFCLLFIAFIFWLPRKKGDWLMLLAIGSFVLLYFAYYGVTIRYYLPVIFALALASARGLYNLGRVVSGYRVTGGRIGMTCACFLAGSFLWTVIIPNNRQDYKEQKFRIDPFISVKKNKLENAVVILRSTPKVYWNYPEHDATFYTQNAPDFNGPLLFVRDLGEKNKTLKLSYPNRRIFFYDYDFSRGKSTLSEWKQ